MPWPLQPVQLLHINPDSISGRAGMRRTEPAAATTKPMTPVGMALPSARCRNPAQPALSNLRLTGYDKFAIFTPMAENR